jgi:hypothetical protein
VVGPAESKEAACITVLSQCADGVEAVTTAVLKRFSVAEFWHLSSERGVPAFQADRVTTLSAFPLDPTD